MSSDNKTRSASFVLRRSIIAPYVLLPALLVLIVVISIPYMAKTGDFSPLLASSGLLVLFVFPIVYMNARYRIWWRNGELVMRAGGFAGVVVTMEAEDIERIKQETSNARIFAKMKRPFRRIAIYGKTAQGYPYIDISLKHFNLGDVHKLMKIIHERRPDLEMPKGWG